MTLPSGSKTPSPRPSTIFWVWAHTTAFRQGSSSFTSVKGLSTSFTSGVLARRYRAVTSSARVMGSLEPKAVSVLPSTRPSSVTRSTYSLAQPGTSVYWGASAAKAVPASPAASPRASSSAVSLCSLFMSRFLLAVFFVGIISRRARARPGKAESGGARQRETPRAEGPLGAARPHGRGNRREAESKAHSWFRQNAAEPPHI